MKDSIRFKLISFANCLVPKNSYKCFFYDRGMISYNEISMLTWASDNQLVKKYQMIYFTNNPTAARKMFPETVKIISNPIKGFFHQLSSKYVFVEQNGHQWMCRPAHKQLMVQLWHGTPIKKVGNLNHTTHWFSYDDVFSRVLAPSEYAWSIMRKCFSYSDNKKIICPYPRCDELLNQNAKDLRKKLGLDDKSRIGVWLPTFRTAYYETHGSNDAPDFPILTENNINILNGLLKRSNTTVIVKMHVLQRRLPFFDTNYSNIIFMDNAALVDMEMSLYSLLGASDCLISDYSSVIFDYLLVNKPIVFTVDDYYSYKDNRGFIDEDMFNNVPGPTAHDVEELVISIESVLTKDAYESERNTLCRKMNKEGIRLGDYAATVFRQFGIEK